MKTQLGAATFQSPTHHTREAPLFGHRYATQGDWKVAPPSGPTAALPHNSKVMCSRKDVRFRAAAHVTSFVDTRHGE